MGFAMTNDEAKPVTKTPCDECPWRRNSIPGFTGPESPQTWIDCAHGDGYIACHKTIKKSGTVSGQTQWSHQCAGAAIFRANVHKQPRDPDVTVLPADRKAVFARNEEFMEHHDLAPRMMALPKWMLEEWASGRRGTKSELVDLILRYRSRWHSTVLEEYEAQAREQQR